MLFVSDHELGARRQITADALGPVHLRLPCGVVVVAGQQNRVRDVAVLVDSAAEVDLAVGERRKLDLHGISKKRRGRREGRPQSATARGRNRISRYVRRTTGVRSMCSECCYRTA